MAMKVTRGQIFSRGLANCCPNCGGRTLFKEGSCFAMNPACPRCGLKFERDEGFFLGSMSLNYGVTVAGFIAPVAVLAFRRAIPIPWAIGLAAAGSVIFPVLFYRSSRSWWLMNYYAFLPQHLPANQTADRGGSAPGDENI